ncbi:TPA: hypothetical protein CPT82_05340 [Candidatus Gastranaerophilales bacterium HUM_2]|nr:MAG TPA: hypothetical protein CPT82_05340 [Candidatus Gastranaerophilales bacterium HUM_2]
MRKVIFKLKYVYLSLLCTYYRWLLNKVKSGSLLFGKDIFTCSFIIEHEILKLENSLKNFYTKFSLLE